MMELTFDRTADFPQILDDERESGRIGQACKQFLKKISKGNFLDKEIDIPVNIDQVKENIGQIAETCHSIANGKAISESIFHHKPDVVFYNEEILKRSFTEQCENVVIRNIDVQSKCEYDENTFSILASQRMNLIDAKKYVEQAYPEYESQINEIITQEIWDIPNSATAERMKTTDIVISKKMECEKGQNYSGDKEQLNMQYTLYFGDVPVMRKKASFDIDENSNVKSIYATFNGTCAGKSFTDEQWNEIFNQSDKSQYLLDFKKAGSFILAKTIGNPVGQAVAAGAMAVAVNHCNLPPDFTFGMTMAFAGVSAMKVFETTMNLCEKAVKEAVFAVRDIFAKVFNKTFSEKEKPENKLTQKTVSMDNISDVVEITESIENAFKDSARKTFQGKNDTAINNIHNIEKMKEVKSQFNFEKCMECLQTM